MSFLEWLEAIARCADKFDLKNLEDYFPEYKSRNPYQLDKKMESIIVRLIRANLDEKKADAAISKYREITDGELKNPVKTKFKQIN